MNLPSGLPYLIIPTTTYKVESDVAVSEFVKHMTSIHVPIIELSNFHQIAAWLRMDADAKGTRTKTGSLYDA